MSLYKLRSSRAFLTPDADVAKDYLDRACECFQKAVDEVLHAFILDVVRIPVEGLTVA